MTTRARVGVLASLVLAVLGSLGCDREAPAPAPPASALASASAAPSASAEPERPWFVGTWKGSFRVEPHSIDLDRKHGAPKAWTDEDPSKVGLGEASLEVTLDEAGTATGTAAGALGKLAARGVLDGETLKLRLDPAEPDAFRATAVLDRKGNALEGSLRASSSDSLVVRKATVALQQGQGAAP